jgi:hypothetical protein
MIRQLLLVLVATRGVVRILFLVYHGNQEVYVIYVENK